jgi:hypothetical protein
MNSQDIEVLGVVYAFFTDQKHSNRVRPPLDFGAYHKFVMRYYERCFRENPEGDWANSRFEAGCDLVNWFAILWNDKTVPRSALQELKVWLAGLYRSANPDLRICIVQATLEHLFEPKKFRSFFADWKDDPVLRVAHSEAMEWVRGGGSTPLGEPEWFRRMR